jgi:hypothetical protein
MKGATGLSLAGVAAPLGIGVVVGRPLRDGPQSLSSWSLLPRLGTKALVSGRMTDGAVRG